MRYEATLYEWRELYEAAIKIKEMKPWEKLWDMDLITIIFDKKADPIVCSIMGKGANYYGVGAYIGLDAIHGLFLMAESSEMPPEQTIRYQRCIMCNFGDREDLTKEEYEIIKKLGFKFRGRNNWIYFRVFDPIYVPFMPDKKEVIQMTQILNQLYFALEALNNGFKVDFENGKTLLRFFDKKDNCWIHKEVPVLYPEVEYAVPILDDELLIKRLKTQKYNKSILDLDIVYLNSSINDKKYDKPLAMRLCMMSDRESGQILFQHVMSPEDIDVNVVFNAIINYTLEVGKPKKIFVRDRYMYSMLMDLCKRVGIELEILQELPTIDFFVSMFTLGLMTR